jgi:hypothetical protein
MRKTSAFKKAVQVYKLGIPVFESKTQRNNLNPWPITRLTQSLQQEENRSRKTNKRGAYRVPEKDINAKVTTEAQTTKTKGAANIPRHPKSRCCWA